MGNELRERGLVGPYLEHPTEAGREELGREARALLADACRKLVQDKKG